MSSPLEEEIARASYKARIRQRIDDYWVVVPHDAEIDRDDLDEAIRRIETRTGQGVWDVDRLRHKVRRPRPKPFDAEIAPALTSDAVELLVVRLLARTYGTGQFSVTPAGDVFTGAQYGYHRKAERLYVTTLSPLLDDAADLLLSRDEAGGRMYVHTTRGLIELPRDRSTLARIEID